MGDFGSFSYLSAMRNSDTGKIDAAKYKDWAGKKDNADFIKFKETILNDGDTSNDGLVNNLDKIENESDLGMVLDQSGMLTISNKDSVTSFKQANTDNKGGDNDYNITTKPAAGGDASSRILKFDGQNNISEVVGNDGEAVDRQDVAQDGSVTTFDSKGSKSKLVSADGSHTTEYANNSADDNKSSGNMDMNSLMPLLLMQMMKNNQTPAAAPQGGAQGGMPAFAAMPNNGKECSSLAEATRLYGLQGAHEFKKAHPDLVLAEKADLAQAKSDHFNELAEQRETKPKNWFQRNILGMTAEKASEKSAKWQAKSDGYKDDLNDYQAEQAELNP